MVIDPAFQIVVRSSLGLLLTAAAWHKLAGLPRFRSVVEDYRVLPAALAPAFSLAIPATEIALAAMIASGIGLPVAGAATALMLATYALAIAINLIRGRTDLDCGCMGPARSVPVSPALVVRNAALALVALVLVVPASARDLTFLDGVAALGATATLAACWAASERMLALAPRVALARRRRS